jgi:hypothetical protein
LAGYDVSRHFIAELVSGSNRFRLCYRNLHGLGDTRDHFFRVCINQAESDGVIASFAEDQRPVGCGAVLGRQLKPAGRSPVAFISEGVLVTSLLSTGLEGHVARSFGRKLESDAVVTNVARFTISLKGHRNNHFLAGYDVSRHFIAELVSGSNRFRLCYRNLHGLGDTRDHFFRVCINQAESDGVIASFAEDQRPLCCGAVLGRQVKPAWRSPVAFVGEGVFVIVAVYGLEGNVAPSGPSAANLNLTPS